MVLKKIIADGFFFCIDALHYQQLSIFILIVIGNSILIGQEFVNGFQFFLDEMEKWINPKNNAHEFDKQYISRVMLFYMKQFMPENLLSFFAIEVEIAVPENRFKKGKRRTRFFGVVKFQFLNALMWIFPGYFYYIQY